MPQMVYIIAEVVIKKGNCCFCCHDKVSRRIIVGVMPKVTASDRESKIIPKSLVELVRRATAPSRTSANAEIRSNIAEALMISYGLMPGSSILSL